MKKLFFLFVILLGYPLAAQVIEGGLQYVAVAPSGSCLPNSPAQQVVGSGAIYTCQNGTWTQASGSGAPGTITGVTAGTGLSGGGSTGTVTLTTVSVPATAGYELGGNVSAASAPYLFTYNATQISNADRCAAWAAGLGTTINSVTNFQVDARPEIAANITCASNMLTGSPAGALFLPPGTINVQVGQQLANGANGMHIVGEGVSGITLLKACASGVSGCPADITKHAAGNITAVIGMGPTAPTNANDVVGSSFENLTVEANGVPGVMGVAVTAAQEMTEFPHLNVKDSALVQFDIGEDTNSVQNGVSLHDFYFIMNPSVSTYNPCPTAVIPSISTISNTTGGVATVTLSGAPTPALAQFGEVIIAGQSNGGTHGIVYNGPAEIQSVISATSFTYNVNAGGLADSATGNGTVQMGPMGLRVDSTPNGGGRDIYNGTMVAAACNASFTNPVVGTTIDGGVWEEHNMHVEDALYGAVIGSNHNTRDIRISHFSPVTNIVNGVLISNKWATSNIDIDTLVTTQGGGTPNTTSLIDQINSNTLTPANNGHLGHYWLDSAAYPWTTANPVSGTEIANGFDFYNGTFSIFNSGTAAFQVNNSGGGVIQGTFANGNNPLIVKCALTSGTTCLTTGETTAATTAGAAEDQITTLTTSTAIALQVTQGANGPANANAPSILNISAAAAGGLAGASNNGSTGATIALLTGAGSAGGATTGNGGQGGNFTMTQGNGGAGGGTTTNNGGAGGGLSWTTGTGGNAAATGTSGAGGSWTLNFGAGGSTGTTLGAPGGLNLLQGANLSATNGPVLNMTGTFNNASLAGPFISAAVTNTSSTANAIYMQLLGGTSANTTEFAVSMGGVVTTGAAIKSGTGLFEHSSGTAAVSFCGGLCTNNTNAAQGGGLFQGSDASSNGASVQAGYGIFRGGINTNATPNAAALEGVTQLESGALKGAAVAAVGDVVCGTSTAFTVTDCSATGPAVNIAGIATSTSNPIGYVTNGQALVKTDGAVTIGDILCMGTTAAGQAHDNGTVPCRTPGTMVGVVLATSGTITTASGATTAATAMSTTLPLVQLMIGGGGVGALATVNQTGLTGVISTATLCAAAICGNGSAGQYHVHWDFWGSGTACSSVTAGSVTFLLTWTDENAVTHSAVALQMMGQTGAATTAMGGTFPFQTALANEGASGDATISTNGTIVQYATGYTACTTGTGTYNLRASVTRVQ